MSELQESANMAMLEILLIFMNDTIINPLLECLERVDKESLKIKDVFEDIEYNMSKFIKVNYFSNIKIRELLPCVIGIS